MHLAGKQEETGCRVRKSALRVPLLLRPQAVFDNNRFGEAGSTAQASVRVERDRVEDDLSS